MMNNNQQKFKCRQCGKTEMYPNESDAYINGWFLGGMELRNNILPIGLEICYECGTKPFESHRPNQGE